MIRHGHGVEFGASGNSQRPAVLKPRLLHFSFDVAVFKHNSKAQAGISEETHRIISRSFFILVL